MSAAAELTMDAQMKILSHADIIKRKARELKESCIAALAYSLADSAARSDIEVYCVPVTDAAKTRTPIEQISSCWYDTTDVMPTDREIADAVDLACKYLDLRGKLQRHPEHAHLVRPTA